MGLAGHPGRAAAAGRRHAVLTVRRAGRAIRRTPLRRVLEFRATGWLRQWLFRVRTRDVLQVLTALSEAGVNAALVGGWGVDALLGHQTRWHADLDVGLMETSGTQQSRAEEVLGRCGFVLQERRHIPGIWMPDLTIMRDSIGRQIELLPLSALVNDDVTVGMIAGHPVPCISAALQLKYHSGYPPRESDRRDIDLLCHRFGLSAPRDNNDEPCRPPRFRRARRRRDAKPTSSAALIIPVRSAGRALRGLCGPPDDGLPFHITVLAPFLPTGGITADVIAELQALIATFPSFGFQLTRIERFPDVLYLPPEPEEPFQALTAAVVARWPECPPYGGEFANVIPHLTVGYLPTAASLGDDIVPRLPFTASAQEIWLMRPNRTGRWSRSARFSLRADPPA